MTRTLDVVVYMRTYTRYSVVVVRSTLRSKKSLESLEPRARKSIDLYEASVVSSSSSSSQSSRFMAGNRANLTDPNRITSQCETRIAKRIFENTRKACRWFFPPFDWQWYCCFEDQWNKRNPVTVSNSQRSHCQILVSAPQIDLLRQIFKLHRVYIIIISLRIGNEFNYSLPWFQY